MGETITEFTEEVEPATKALPKLEPSLKDNLTDEQRKRDKHTSILLEQFVKANDEKRAFAKIAKKVICVFCLGWVSILIVTCIALACFILTQTKRTTTDIIALISALAPLLATIVGTLNIVTKHVFPEDEDRNITEIVKAIQDNDLKNKQVNIRQNEDEPPAN